jgi:WD40 repeat protein
MSLFNSLISPQNGKLMRLQLLPLLVVFMLGACVSPEPSTAFREQNVKLPPSEELSYRAGKVVRIGGHWDQVTAMALGRNAKILATGSSDLTVRLWSTDSGNELFRFHGHTQAVSALAIAASGRLLASGGHDMTVRVWSASDKVEIRRFGGHKRFVTAVALSSDGGLVASGSHDGRMCIWDVENGVAVSCVEAHTKSVSDVEFTEDDQSVLTASEDGTAALWEIGKKEPTFRLDGKVGAINSASRVGSTILMAGEAGVPEIWPSDSEGSMRKLQETPKPVRLVRLSPDASLALIIDGPTGAWRLWRQGTSNNYSYISPLAGLAMDAVIADDGSIAIACQDETLRFYSPVR